MFRRGLPRGLRAYPGIVKLPEDTAAGYLARVRRMAVGRTVAGDLRRARLAAGGAAAAEALERAAERIGAMSATGALEAQLEALSAEEQRGNAEVSERAGAIAALHRQRRAASRETMFRLDREILSAERALQVLRRRQAEGVRRREAVQQQIETLAVGAALAEEAGALAAGMRAGTLGEAELAQGLERLGAGLATLDGTLRRFLIGDVPWRDWAGPLGRWALLVGCTYLVLMAFNVLVFRQWAHHEKLIYPLAELPPYT